MDSGDSLDWVYKVVGRMERKISGEIWRRRIHFPIRPISKATRIFSLLPLVDSPDRLNINQVNQSTKQLHYSTAGHREKES